MLFDEHYLLAGHLKHLAELEHVVRFQQERQCLVQRLLVCPPVVKHSECKLPNTLIYPQALVVGVSK